MCSDFSINENEKIDDIFDNIFDDLMKNANTEMKDIYYMLLKDMFKSIYFMWSIMQDDIKTISDIRCNHFLRMMAYQNLFIEIDILKINIKEAYEREKLL